MVRWGFLAVAPWDAAPEIEAREYSILHGRCIEVSVRIVMTLLVRDEIDIIRACVNYHYAEGIDFIVATDNGSVDGTVDVLEEYAQQGRMEVIHEPPGDYSQGAWVTRMARRAGREHGADWVINADADEFFFWRHGNLKAALERVPASTFAISAIRHDFVPLDRPGAAPAPLEMQYRLTGSRNLFNLKPLIPKAIHRGHPGIIVEMGNHRVSGEGVPQGLAPGEIEVYHYPIRSYPQFVSKAVNTGSSLEKNRSLPKKIAQRPRQWYQLWKEGRLEEEYRARVHFPPAKLLAAVESGDLVHDASLAARLKAHGLA